MDARRARQAVVELMEVAFDEASHTYIVPATGECLPSVTELLERAGWRDTRWYTPEGSERGTLVHKLTARYDLKLMTEAQLKALTGHVRPWLLAHVDAMKKCPHTWRRVEVPTASERYRIAGTPDRDGMIYEAIATLNVKTGQRDKKADDVGEALYALLLEEQLHLKADFIKRYIEYIRPSGRFSIEECEGPCSMAEARRIVQKYAA